MPNAVVPLPLHGKPSYKEYDDKATPNLSTQHMHPLGELPPSRVVEATKRPYAYQAKKKGKGKSAAANGSAPAGAGGEGRSGQSKAVTPSAPASAVYNTATTATTTTTPSDASGRASGSPSAQAPSRPTPPNPWLNGIAPSSKTAQGRARLSMVVDAAVHRSRITGHTDMGRAIKKLYEESLSDHSLADLLDAVLAQKSTPQQFQQFQNYVRNARANPDNENTSSALMERDSERIEIKTEPVATPQGFNGVGEKPPTKCGVRGHKAEPVDEGSATSTAASTPQPTGVEMVHPSKRVKIPSYDELKTESHIRAPPKPLVRKRGKKRARSPSPVRTCLKKDCSTPLSARNALSCREPLFSGKMVPQVVERRRRFYGFCKGS